MNRVKNQKLNQRTPYDAIWLSFWCSTQPSADACNKSVVLLHHHQIILDALTDTVGASTVHRQYMPGCTDDDMIGTDSLTASAEGRVEHQKLNQAAP